MVNPNVLRAVGEAFETHQIKIRPGEHMGDTVARTFHISESEANLWLEALAEGCNISEANRRAGIVARVDTEPVLNTLARLVGKALGAMTPRNQPPCPDPAHRHP